MIWKRLLVLLFAGVFCFSTLQFFGIQSEYQDGKDTYQAIERNVVIPVQSSSSAEIEKENNGETVPIRVDFETLLQLNPDVVGWIYSEGTEINYPVLKGRDNEEYLHRMINGQENSSGSIFMDQMCQKDMSSFNTILYGHHMKNGTMFGSIYDYTEPGYFEAHPIFWLLTPEKNYRVSVLAGMLVFANDEIYTYCENREQLLKLMSRVQEHSVFEAQDNRRMEEFQQTVTFSTCAYEDQDTRFVLIGGLEEIESGS